MTNSMENPGVDKNLDGSTKNFESFDARTSQTKRMYNLPDGRVAELTAEEYNQEVADFNDRSSS